jgi:hypothetical protein
MEISAILLGDPWFWGKAWEQLKGFNVLSPIGLSILDFHLLAEWLEKCEGLGTSSPPCYYIDMRTLDQLCNGFTEISLRSYFSFPVERSLSKKLVFLLVETCPDYSYPLLLVLNFEEERALFLGANEDGRRYDHPGWFYTIWNAVGDFFGWETYACRDIILKNWIPVCLFHFQRQNLIQLDKRLGRPRFWTKSGVFVSFLLISRVAVGERWMGLPY